MFHIGIWLFVFTIDVFSVIYWFSLSAFGVLWGPPTSRGLCQVSYQASTAWEVQAWDMKTTVSILCKTFLWKEALCDNYIYVFLLLTNTFCLIRYNGLFPSILCDIGIGLFEFLLGVIFVIYWFSLSSIGVLWRPYSRCGSCQVG